VAFPELVRIMVDTDLDRAGVPAPGDGHRIVRERFDDWYTEDTHLSTALQRAAESHQDRSTTGRAI
jgi:hypothetical protein